MRTWLTKNRELLYPTLAVVIGILALANSVRYGWLTPSALEANKDALSALSSGLNIIVVILGSVFSYYRFFRGRTFFARADVDIDISVMATTENYNIHAITTKATNIGNLAIWDPTPEVIIYQIGQNGTTEERWANWQEARSPWEKERTIAVIDSGEAVTFTGTLNVDKETWAVTYVAFLRSSRGEIWKHSATVSNLLKDNN